MSSVLSNTANLKRSELLVVVKVDPTTYSAAGVAGSTKTLAVGTVLRSLGVKVVTPAQGSAPSTDNQVRLLKVVVVGSATNAQASNGDYGDGDDTANTFYVNLLDGNVARL
jgi:hypothetical protein